MCVPSCVLVLVVIVWRGPWGRCVCALLSERVCVSVSVCVLSFHAVQWALSLLRNALDCSGVLLCFLAIWHVNNTPRCVPRFLRKHVRLPTQLLRSSVVECHHHNPPPPDL